MLETVYFYCAALGSAFLILQLLMLFLGGGNDGGDLDVGGDVDMDDTPGHDHGLWLLEVISMRTVASAASFFGLAGLSCLSAGLDSKVSLVVASATGIGAMYAVYWAFRQLFRVLQSSGNENIRNSLGHPGTVYLSIPANDQGLGKVHLEMQGRTVEYQALTSDSEQLPTGTSIVVLDIVNTDTVRVTKDVA
ncbi:hypothetical protein [Aeoliella mucimassa]|uniref:NfeD-like C-terminal domain-containing protein n=1 Tax=Aeoliella mucimassa TaxID=2527972 RepID=A0A518AU16_9BACT|nr:hypothetical protein [Aeoliella mucimassa]QDU58207.1 hypothetical protein Pan181_44400 [Aeoliella mucimassa]